MKIENVIKSLAAVAAVILISGFDAYSQNCRLKPVVFPKGSQTVTITGRSNGCNEYLFKIKGDHRLQMQLSSVVEGVYFELFQTAETDVEGDACDDCRRLDYYFDRDVTRHLSIFGSDEEQSVPFTLTITMTISPPIIEGGMLNGKATNLVRPTTSPEARRAGAAGAVVVRVKVGEDGEVYFAEAISGNELLRDAAEKAALRSRFNTTIVDGIKVRVSGTIEYDFQ